MNVHIEPFDYIHSLERQTEFLINPDIFVSVNVLLNAVPPTFTLCNIVCVCNSKCPDVIAGASGKYVVSIKSGGTWTAPTEDARLTPRFWHITSAGAFLTVLLIDAYVRPLIGIA